MPGMTSPSASASPPRGLHLGVMLVAAAAAIALSRGPGADARDRSTALAQALVRRGIAAAPADVLWVDPPRGVGSLGPGSRALVRGSLAQGEPSELFLVDAELSPEGVLIGVRGVHNLTETSGADESRPVIRGEVAAYVARPLIEGASPTVHVLDLGGYPPPAGGWTRVERAQSAISNWQATGRLSGIGRRTYAVEPAPGDEGAPEGQGAGAGAEVQLGIEGGALVVRSSGREARVALAEGGAPPPAWLRPEHGEQARPGNLVTWAVDRVRNEIGDEAMQYVKMIGLGAIDVVKRQTEDSESSAADIAAEMGQSELGPPSRQAPTDPELGWPPAPIEPWVTPALPGEGEWNPQGGDAFLRKLPGLPPAFMTTFIRPDRSRKVVRTFIALWDPRQVELHMMCGTVEPKGATGEAGPGLIPRTPEVMKRVVAGSNAGFQALHGEFGMMADGVVYLPPKPYAATVAVRRDGSTVFGSWPEDPRIPDWMLSYRQNMTVMVEDQKFNPYNRTWWGGTPPGWADKSHTVRTGICLTKEKFVAYFYGADLSPDALAQSMIQARCAYGIALDMNAGHSGLEFYHVAPTDELPALGRPLQNDWEAEGEISGLEGWRFRGRRLIRGMGLMNFPRYIRREARDFFYMTLRHVLPGPGLTPVIPGQEGEGEWRVKGLPQHGFPYALALTELRADAARPELKVRVLKVDPRTVRAVPAGDAASAPTVAVVGGGEAGGGAAGAGAAGVGAAGGEGEVASLWHSEGAFSIAPAPPVAGAMRIATGRASTSGAPGAVAAIGVEDEGGMLIYAEIEGGAAAVAPAAAPARSADPAAPPAGDPRDAKLLDDFLKRLGCSSRLLLPRRLTLALGGDSDLAGAAIRPPSGAGVVRLVRTEAPGAGRMFENTPVVPFDTWYPLQQKRIRYFKKPKSEDPGDEAN